VIASFRPGEVHDIRRVSFPTDLLREISEAQFQIYNHLFPLVTLPAAEPIMRLSRSVLILALIAAPLSAGAEGVGDAMNAFGFGGSWSNNCAASTGRFRVNVNVAAGEATVTVDLRVESGTEIAESEVIEATRISDDQIRLKLRLIEYTGPGKRLEKYEQTWEKAGAKLRVNKDLLLEKCLN
jgi:hypothetical protein